MVEMVWSKNVIVIGETGVGKSSVVNLILGEEKAQTSNSTTRGTFSINEHSYEDFFLWDTIGYNDTAEKNPTETVQNLAKFVGKIHGGGVSLIIYVMKKGRINAVSKTNYTYFVEKVCQNRVPVLLFVTHCEDQKPGDDWYLGEKENFEEQGMFFHGTINGCAINLDNDNIDPDLIPFLTTKRMRAQQAVRNKMREMSLFPPWKPEDPFKWFKDIILPLVVLGIQAGAFLAMGPVVSGYFPASALAALVATFAKAGPR